MPGRKALCVTTQTRFLAARCQAQFQVMPSSEPASGRQAWPTRRIFSGGFRRASSRMKTTFLFSLRMIQKCFAANKESCFASTVARAARKKKHRASGSLGRRRSLMRILAMHDRYRIRGGEDECFDSELRMLREAGH